VLSGELEVGRAVQAGGAFTAILAAMTVVVEHFEALSRLSAGVDRLVLALLCNAFAEDKAPDDKGKEEVRTVMRFHPLVAPIKVAVFPLLKNKPELVAKARAVFESIRHRWAAFYDDGGAIGRRYRRQDEAGTPYGLTVDFQTLEDDTGTLRDRDTMAQERVKIADLAGKLAETLG
jgi:glycyl-tRNA synthetase